MDYEVETNEWPCVLQTWWKLEILGILCGKNRKFWNVLIPVVPEL